MNLDLLLDDATPPGPKSGPKWILLLSALCLIAAGLFVLYGRPEKQEPAATLSSLPRPTPGTPYVMLRAEQGAFPLHAMRLFSASESFFPGGGSPLAALLPVLNASRQAALIVAERPHGIALSAAFCTDEKTHRTLAAGRLPEKIAELFLLPGLTKTEAKGVYRLQAANVALPLYLSTKDDCTYVTDSLTDMEKILGIRRGKESGIDHQWRIDAGHRAALLISDGGIAASYFSAARTPPAPLELEIGWTPAPERSPDIPPTDDIPGGEAEWHLSGLEQVAGKSFLASCKPFDWSRTDFFIPDPPIAVIGFNLPAPGKRLQALPRPLSDVAAQLGRMKLKASDIQTLLSGPFALSLGGRTNVLWFELPGIVLDVPGRGDAGGRLVEKFWAELFSGTAPKPVDGYAQGGMAEMPFSILAAANPDTAVLGLTAPDAERSTEIAQILARRGNAVGWLFVDLPKLGASISDMPTFGALVTDHDTIDMDEADDGAGENEIADDLRKATSGLGKLFILIEAATNGRALWYY